MTRHDLATIFNPQLQRFIQRTLDKRDKKRVVSPITCDLQGPEVIVQADRRAIYGHRRPGFTIVDLVVVLGICAILIGLLAPALSGAVEHARASRTAAQVRQNSQLVALYTADSKGIYPIGSKLWYNAAFKWYEPMVSAGYLSSVAEADPDGMSKFGFVGVCMSGSLVSDPGIMRRGFTVPVGSASSSPVRADQVARPAEKGMMLQYFIKSGKNQSHYWCCSHVLSTSAVAFTDGSCDSGRWVDFAQQPVAVENSVGYPVISTWNGYLGQDKY